MSPSLNMLYDEPLNRLFRNSPTTKAQCVQSFIALGFALNNRLFVDRIVFTIFWSLPLQYRLKRSLTGEIDRLKVMVVARGFTQRDSREGSDYFDRVIRPWLAIAKVYREYSLVLSSDSGRSVAVYVRYD